MGLRSSAPAHGEDSRGVLQSMTEFKIEKADLRDPLVQWLNSALGDSTLPSVKSIHFEPSTASNIIEVHLEIFGASFEKADQITNTFLSTLPETVENFSSQDDEHPFNADEVRIMSTGFALA